MSMGKIIKSACAVVFIGGLLLFFGTAGALEGGTITLGQAAVRTAIIFGAMAALLVIGRLHIADD